MKFAARCKTERSNHSSALKAHCARNTNNIFSTNIAKYLIQLTLLRRYSKTGSKLYTIEYWHQAGDTDISNNDMHCGRCSGQQAKKFLSLATLGNER